MRSKTFVKVFGVTLIEVLVAITVISTVLLPVAMFLIEYLKNSDQLGNSTQVISILEEKMEQALAQPYSSLPLGLNENHRVYYNEKVVVDLSPLALEGEVVNFSLRVDLFPLEFSVISDSSTGKTEKFKSDDSMKRLVIIATWGKKREHTLDLIAYKADL